METKDFLVRTFFSHNKNILYNIKMEGDYPRKRIWTWDAESINSQLS